jgi:hypothetical protein
MIKQRKALPFWFKGEFQSVIDEYINLFPKEQRTERFFRKTGTKIPIGKNTLGKYPSIIANNLKLNNPEKYTGHAYVAGICIYYMISLWKTFGIMVGPTSWTNYNSLLPFSWSNCLRFNSLI